MPVVLGVADEVLKVLLGRLPGGLLGARRDLCGRGRGAADQPREPLLVVGLRGDAVVGHKLGYAVARGHGVVNPPRADVDCRAREGQFRGKGAPARACAALEHGDGEALGAEGVGGGEAGDSCSYDDCRGGRSRERGVVGDRRDRESREGTRVGCGGGLRRRLCTRGEKEACGGDDEKGEPAADAAGGRRWHSEREG